MERAISASNDRVITVTFASIVIQIAPGMRRRKFPDCERQKKGGSEREGADGGRGGGGEGAEGGNRGE